MYHVHLGTGIDKTYRSVQEMMGDAMLGVIDAQARIYHAETKQWVPVTRHRELGRALLGGAEFPPDSLLEFAALTPEELAEVEEVAATTFSTRKRTPDAPPPPPPPKPAPRDAFYEEPPPPADLEGAIVLDDSAPAEYTSLDWRPERRMGPRVLAGAAIVLALFLVAGWFAWRWWTTPPAIVTPTEPVAATPATGNTGAPAPKPGLSDSAIAAGLAQAESLANENKPRSTPRARPGAITAATPRAVVNSSPSELQMSYAASYSSVRASMDSALDIAGVRRLFTLARLSSPDSLRSARRALTAARNIFRSYRGDEVQVERAFRDTVEYLVREAGWGSNQKSTWDARTSFKDSYEGAQLTDSLLISVDRIYTLLLAEWGTWAREGAAVRFNDPSAAQEYGRETAWLDNRLDRLAAATSPVATVRRLQSAIGDTRPPLLAPR